jgi:hypothetical protein
VDRPRLYSDREVQLILKSAVELQMRADEFHQPAGGMSLEQLEQVAREAGLDAAVIRRAAAQLELANDSGINVLLGSPDHVIAERTVDFAIEQSEFDRLLEVARSMSREVGEVSTVGRQFGWKGSLDGAKTDVTVSVSDHSTTVRVRIDLENEVMGHFMLKGVLGGGMGGVVGAGAIASLTGVGALAIAAGAVVGGAGYLWARRGLRKSAASYRARAEELVEALVARARDIYY